MDNYHVTKEDDAWKFGKEGVKRSISTAETKAEAIKDMRQYMKTHEGSVKIHKENGRIQEERTYPGSKDPRSSKG